MLLLWLLLLYSTQFCLSCYIILQKHSSAEAPAFTTFSLMTIFYNWKKVWYSTDNYISFRRLLRLPTNSFFVFSDSAALLFCCSVFFSHALVNNPQCHTQGHYSHICTRKLYIFQPAYYYYYCCCSRNVNQIHFKWMYKH